MTTLRISPIEVPFEGMDDVGFHGLFHFLVVWFPSYAQQHVINLSSPNAGPVHTSAGRLFTICSGKLNVGMPSCSELKLKPAPPGRGRRMAGSSWHWPQRTWLLLALVPPTEQSWVQCPAQIQLGIPQDLGWWSGTPSGTSACLHLKYVLNFC